MYLPGFESAPESGSTAPILIVSGMFAAGAAVPVVVVPPVPPPPHAATTKAATYVWSPTRSAARNVTFGAATGVQPPRQNRTVPSSPATTTSSTDRAAIARSVDVMPLGTGRQPASSRRYVTPPAPAAHADSGPKATTA